MQAFRCGRTSPTCFQRADRINRSSDLAKSPGNFCVHSDACITFCILSCTSAISMVAQTQVFVGIQSAAFGLYGIADVFGRSGGPPLRERYWGSNSALANKPAQRSQMQVQSDQVSLLHAWRTQANTIKQVLPFGRPLNDPHDPSTLMQWVLPLT